MNTAGFTWTETKDVTPSDAEEMLKMIAEAKEKNTKAAKREREGFEPVVS